MYVTAALSDSLSAYLFFSSLFFGTPPLLHFHLLTELIPALSGLYTVLLYRYPHQFFPHNEGVLGPFVHVSGKVLKSLPGSIE